MALLRERLRAANRDNSEFEAQYGRLEKAVEAALERLEERYGKRIERVLAVGEWADERIDLRNLAFEDVELRIVLRSAERPFALYEQLAAEVFAHLDDGEILVQFSLETLAEWRHAERLARAEGRAGELGVPLLIRG